LSAILVGGSALPYPFSVYGKNQWRAFSADPSRQLSGNIVFAGVFKQSLLLPASRGGHPYDYPFSPDSCSYAVAPLRPHGAVILVEANRLPSCERGRTSGCRQVSEARDQLVRLVSIFYGDDAALHDGRVFTPIFSTVPVCVARNIPVFFFPNHALPAWFARFHHGCKPNQVADVLGPCPPRSQIGNFNTLSSQ